MGHVAPVSCLDMIVDGGWYLPCAESLAVKRYPASMSNLVDLRVTQQYVAEWHLLHWYSNAARDTRDEGDPGSKREGNPGSMRLRQTGKITCEPVSRRHAVICVRLRASSFRTAITTTRPWATT